MNGTITMSDGTEILLTTITIAARQGTGYIGTTDIVYARQHTREECQLRLADGQQAKIYLGGVSTSRIENQEAVKVLHFHFVGGWD